MGGSSSIFRLRRTDNPSPSSTFGAGKNEEPPIFHLLSTGRTKNTSPPSSSSDPPPSTNPHQVLSALLRSGSSARSSTLKIGPKIEIGPLRSFPKNPPPSKNPSIFEEFPHFRRTRHLRRNFSFPKNPPSSIFEAEDRTSADCFRDPKMSWCSQL